MKIEFNKIRVANVGTLENVCIVSKDELIDFLDLFYDKAWGSTGEGWNGEIQPLNYMTDGEKLEYTKQKKELINQMLNQ